MTCPTCRGQMLEGALPPHAFGDTYCQAFLCLNCRVVVVDPHEFRRAMPSQRGVELRTLGTGEVVLDGFVPDEQTPEKELEDWFYRAMEDD